MSDYTKEQLESFEDYFTARIAHEQPNPDERLFVELGRVCYQLNQLDEERTQAIVELEESLGARVIGLWHGSGEPA